MAKDDYYTFKSDPKDANHFSAVIVDKDFEILAKRYEINGSVCDCWAGHKWCRHKQMLVLFKQKQLIDTNTYYNYDKEKWLSMPQQEM